MNHTRPGNRRGFTLVELMIVIAIIGIIAAVAYPSYKGLKNDRALYSEARKLKENLRYMQQLAISVGQSCRMDFTADGYTIIYGATTDKAFRFENSVYYSGGSSLTFNKNGLPEGVALSETITLSKGSGASIYVKVLPGGKIDVVWSP